MRIHRSRPEAEVWASVDREAAAVRVSRACCAAGYRSAGANFSTKKHVGAAAGRSGGPQRSRCDSPDWKDACSPPAPARLRPTADLPQEAPEQQASEWPPLAATGPALEGT